MNNSYQVKVNNAFDFEIDKKTVLNLDSLKVSDAEFHVLQNTNSYKSEITEANFNQKK